MQVYVTPSLLYEKLDDTKVHERQHTKFIRAPNFLQLECLYMHTSTDACIEVSHVHSSWWKIILTNEETINTFGAIFGNPSYGWSEKKDPILTSAKANVCRVQEKVAEHVDILPAVAFE